MAGPARLAVACRALSRAADWLRLHRGDTFSDVSNAGCQGAGEGSPTPRRRTFAKALQASAHSDADFATASYLRSSSYAGSRGMVGPAPRGWTEAAAPRANARPGGPGHHRWAEARQGTVGRMPSLAVKAAVIIRRLSGHGRPLTSRIGQQQAASSLAPGPEGRVITGGRRPVKKREHDARRFVLPRSTSERRLAKGKRQDVVFPVKPRGGPPRRGRQDAERSREAHSASSVRSVTSMSRSRASAGDSCGKFVSTTSFA
jgi:hypothetical protein